MNNNWEKWYLCLLHIPLRKHCEKCRRFCLASSSLHLKSLWLSQGSQYVISSLTEVLGPAQLLLPGGKSLGSRRQGCCTWLPSRYCSLIAFQRPLFELMFALGGPNIQQSARNFSLFVENCRFQMQSLALKKNLQVNTKSTNLHFIHKQ